MFEACRMLKFYWLKTEPNITPGETDISAVQVTNNESKFSAMDASV